MPPKAKRFSGVYLNEHEIEEIINRSGKVLDFSGANLAGDQPLFIVDNILSHKLYQFIAIDISSTKISLQGLESLVLAATQMNSLESFDCKDNNVGSSGGNILSKFLSSTKSLKALDISSNDLGDTGVTSVASAFSIDLADAMRKDSSSLFTLVALDLSNNNLGDMAILSLCRSLTQLIRYSAPANKAPALEVLHLNNNSIGDKAAICLAQLINSRRSGDNKASLQLKELGLNDNPISSKGIIALLGSAAEGARSPLRLLLLNRCQPSIGVLNHLATNIRSSYCDLECLEMSFTAKNARLAVMDSAALYSDPKHQASSLSMTFKTLIDAIFNHVCSIKRIHLGMLHEAIFETCVEATREFMSAQQRDTTHALENINTASEIFGVPYVSNVLDWVKAGLYDNTVLFGKPVDMVIRRRSSDSESLKFELKAPAKANSNFLSNLSTQLKADEGITSTKENGFHKSIKSQLQVDRDNHTYKSISTSIGVVSTQSKNKLDLDDTELSMENKSLVDLKEKEYLKLRTEHKNAFHDLAEEIEKLAMLQKKSTGERTEAILDINESVSRVEDTNTSSSGYNMNSQRYSHTGNMRENLESFNDISSNNIHNSSSNIHNISSNINTSNYQRATIDESGSALSKENVQFLIQETVNQIMNQSNGNLNFKSTSPTAPTTFARVTHDENIYAIISSIQASIQSIESKHTSYETFMKSKLGELEARVESLEHRASSDQRFNASNIHASLGDRPLNGLATKPLGNFSTPLLSDFQNEGSALLISELTSRLEMLEQAIELDKASSSNLSTALILQQQKQERRDYRSELLERLKRGSPLNSRHTSPARRQSQEDDESEEDASGWQGGTTEEILNPDNDSMRRSGSFDPQERSTPRSRASREVVRPNTSIPPPLPSVRNGAMSRSTSRGGDIDMATLSRDDSTITSSNNTGGPNRKRTISGNSYINNPMLSSNGYNAPNGSHIGAPAQGRPNDSMQRTNAIRAAFHQPSFLQPTYASSKKVNNSSRNSPQR